MNSSISFIIPAYNAGQYLQDCLDSIFALKLNGCESEVIVVNDGSTDNTADLLERYRQMHTLTVIHQDNQGLSMARNRGIEAASGQYLCFVDADDRLCPVDSTPLLMAMREGFDLIGINLHEVNARGKRYPYRRYEPEYNRPYRSAKEFMRNRNLFPCAVAYLYRKAFLDQKNLRFYPGIYHEDEEFTPRAFALAESFVALPLDWYDRILRENSITTDPDKAKQQRKLKDMLFVLKRLDALKEESMQCKLDWLTADILQLMIRQNQDSAFCREMISELKSMGYFPLRWRWNWKYLLFRLFTQLVFFNL